MTIKAIFFDFDGTLIPLVEIHYSALNLAIEKIAGNEFIISEKEQFETYNGLSTKTKLKILGQKKKLPEHLFDQINVTKQNYTLHYINDIITINNKLIDALTFLKNDGYILYCVSNAMYATVELGLKKLGIFDIFDKIIGNDSVERQKPHPDIYIQCFLNAKLDPKECLIIEDSLHGIVSGTRSGACVCSVDNDNDITYKNIKGCIEKYNRKWHRIPHPGNNINVVIPMGGAASRFMADPRYKGIPKPLIDVAGKPMIQRVVENLNIDAQYIFIVQKSHYEKYNLDILLPLIAPECKIVQVDGVTQGAACSVLFAKNYIDNDKHLLIANSDQILEWSSSEFIYNMNCRDADGGIQTFTANDPKWSYVRKNEDGYICEVAEKRIISDEASTGIYYFKHGSDFVKYAEQMIEKDIRTNNEYYTAPIFNEMIDANKRVVSYRCNAMHGIGIPSDLESFVANHAELLT